MTVHDIDTVWITLTEKQVAFSDKWATWRQANAERAALLPENNAPVGHDAELELNIIGLRGECAGYIHFGGKGSVTWSYDADESAVRNGKADLEDFIDIKTRREFVARPDGAAGRSVDVGLRARPLSRAPALPDRRLVLGSRRADTGPLEGPGGWPPGLLGDAGRSGHEADLGTRGRGARAPAHEARRVRRLRQGRALPTLLPLWRVGRVWLRRERAARQAWRLLLQGTQTKGARSWRRRPSRSSCGRCERRR